MAVVVLVISLLLLLLRDSASVASQSPPLPAAAGCTDELVSLSPCLGYISAPPTTVTDAAGPECCDAFSKTLKSGGNCLCHLVREPMILGFPLNQSRIATLPSACSWNSSLALDPLPLDVLCSGTTALPPLHSISGSVTQEPFVSGSHNVTPPLLPHSSPPRGSNDLIAPPVGRSPEKPTSSKGPSQLSQSRGHTSSRSSCRRLLPAVLASLVVL